jgi:predicted RecB family nuclease
MKLLGTTLKISASDLSNHLACRHVTTLDLQVARGEIKQEFREDPRIDALIERGKRHEQQYLSHLAASGLNIVHGDVNQTIDAMKRGVDVISQAYLSDGQWQGYADVLLKVKEPSNLGDWSYEVVDTKLARETKGGTILQLCLYSELVASIQGFMPKRMHIITPGKNFQPETYRVHDYLAYHHFVKSRLEDAINTMPKTYPEPVDHCDICSWWPHCNDQRRQDDHLSFVAGISKLQIRELRKQNVNTLADLATTSITKPPERGSMESYEKIHHQAELQLDCRTNHKPVHELLDLEPERGLARLPEPSPGDIFFDFESDPFVEEGGLEYLLGYLDAEGYTALWGLNRNDEQQHFEHFIDLVMDRWQRHPGLHLYHFTHYEPSALKRLAGRYSSKEDELDQMLRAGLFVDLHAILKQTLRASVERYSLKDLEIFFNYKRKTDLRDASKCLRILECELELNDAENIAQDIKDTIQNYNFEDCESTLKLRNWLEDIRTAQIESGKEILRPTAQSAQPSEAVDERRKRVLPLIDRLLTGVPEDPKEHSPQQHANYLMAYMLEWHRREDKATWWEYFRLRELSDEELLEERDAISGLEFVGTVDGGTAQCPIHRYRFPIQDMEVRMGNELKTSEGSLGTVQAVDRVALTIDIKKTQKMAEKHPSSAFVFRFIKSDPQIESLIRLGTWIADHGIEGEGPHSAARDLLLRKTTLNGPASGMGVLPIQGPPGAGKTYTGARMICELVRNHKKVGITAMSHKVIRKLLDEVIKAANEEGLQIQCIQKVSDKSDQEAPGIKETEDNPDPLKALQCGEAQVAAGTAWLWSRAEYSEAVDVLFVDEAGQMSLADVLAVSQSAKSVVLLGDPRQLEQPLQGTHPPGVAVSALQHILDTHETMPEDRGLFMEHTWRLAPSICKFTSELFYEGKLFPREQLAQQRLEGPTRFAGSGLFFVPVEHEGNQSSSDEEVRVIEAIVRELTAPGVSWGDRFGKSLPIYMKDILIVAPYNAQVFKLSERLSPEARIGTVDKFQGQEAPVVIYSITTSSPEDAPRGMEFLYSLNRLNVATSRARCVCILVANPRLFEPECKTPRQMKLANALCRYVEMAEAKS